MIGWIKNSLILAYNWNFYLKKSSSTFSNLEHKMKKKDMRQGLLFHCSHGRHFIRPLQWIHVCADWMSVFYLSVLHLNYLSVLMNGSSPQHKIHISYSLHFCTNFNLQVWRIDKLTQRYYLIRSFSPQNIFTSILWEEKVTR